MSYYKDGIPLGDSLEVDGMVIINPTEEQVVQAGYVFKEDVIVPALSDAKSNRIAESKKALEDYLENHTLTSSCHNGVAAEYTVTEAKQNQLVQSILTYQLESGLGITPELTWNAAGRSCEVWTYQELLQLALEIKEYVKPRISKQRELEEEINECETVEEVQSIVIDYELQEEGEEE